MKKPAKERDLEAEEVEGELDDIEEFPLPEGLLAAAGVESDEDFDAIPEVPLRGTA